MDPFIADKCLYTRYNEGTLELVILIYVDDILIMAADPNVLSRTKEILNRRFQMTDMGNVEYECDGYIVRDVRDSNAVYREDTATI